MGGSFRVLGMDLRFVIKQPGLLAWMRLHFDRKGREMPKHDIMICIPRHEEAESQCAALDALLRVSLETKGATHKGIGLGTYGDGQATRVPATPFAEVVMDAARAIGHEPVVTLTFEVPEYELFETEIKRLISEAGFAGTYHLARWTHEDVSEEDSVSDWKSIEIYYDIADIPAGYDHPLDYRNEAMELIESALTEADAGEWSGAESGIGEVNFGFDVAEFDRAETIVRSAVKGTVYDKIREITRFDTAALSPEERAAFGLQ